MATITKIFDADLADIAVDEDGNLLVGNLIPNGGFYTVSDGTLTIATGLRYRLGQGNISIDSADTEITPQDEDGNDWTFVIAAYIEDIEQPLTDMYDIQLVAQTLQGANLSLTPVNLSWTGIQYILYPLPRSTDEPNTSLINVIEEIVWNEKTNAGRYRVGLQATNKQTGQTFNSVVNLNVPIPNLGITVDDPVLGVGVIIG